MRVSQLMPRRAGVARSDHPGTARACGHHEAGCPHRPSMSCRSSPGAAMRVVLVESPDRFARDLAVQLTGHDYLRSLGVELVQRLRNVKEIVRATGLKLWRYPAADHGGC